MGFVKIDGFYGPYTYMLFLAQIYMAKTLKNNEQERNAQPTLLCENTV